MCLDGCSRFWEWSLEPSEQGDRPQLLACSSCACCFSCSTNSQSPSPPSSSIAYSLLSASSEPDNPSTSGCRCVGGDGEDGGKGTEGQALGLMPVTPSLLVGPAAVNSQLGQGLRKNS